MLLPARQQPTHGVFHRFTLVRGAEPIPQLPAGYGYGQLVSPLLPQLRQPLASSHSRRCPSLGDGTVQIVLSVELRDR